MKIWTTEHVFNYSWETVTKSQLQKHPNPLQPAVLATDVISRRVDSASGILHSHRIISSDWGLAQWVQRLIGANRVCYAHEYSTVDPKRRLMEMRSSNLTFCNFVSMNEVMSYRPHPEEPNCKTLLRQETVVTVRGVPLTSYMEAIILGTVSANAGKGRTAIEWVTERLENETKNLSERLEGIKLEVAELTHKVEDTLISAAKHSIEELQTDLMKIHPPIVKAEETENISSAGNSR